MPSDSVTEVTSQSWFSRLGNAIKGVLIGAVLFVLAFPVLVWNEGRAVKTAKGLAEGAKVAVSVETDKVDKANEGKLIHISGKAETDETLVDPEFGVSANAIHLSRRVEMYQWVQETDTEKRKELGGSEETETTYNYSTDWESHLHDSSDFHTPAGHENPSALPYHGDSWDAEVVTVGAFKLTPALIADIHGRQELAVSTDDLPDQLALRLQAVGTDGFYMSATVPTPQATAPAEEAPDQPVAEPTDEPTDEPTTESNDVEETPADEPAAGLPALSSLPADPTVGDLHITFQVVEPTEVSVLAAQIGETFEPYQTKAGDPVNRLDMGTLSAAAMIDKAQAENNMKTWIWRGVGFLMMLIGLSMVLRPLAVLGDIVPFIGNLVGVGTTLVAGVCALSFSLLTISVAWLVYRPLIGVPLSLAGAATLVFLFQMIRKRGKARAQAA